MLDLSSVNAYTICPHRSCHRCTECCMTRSAGQWRRRVNCQYSWSIPSHTFGYGQNEPYKFTHYLILSRIWRWTADEAQAAMEDVQPTNPPIKKRKQKDRALAEAFPTVNSYHPEDECIQKVCPFLLHSSIIYNNAT